MTSANELGATSADAVGAAAGHGHPLVAHGTLRPAGGLLAILIAIVGVAVIVVHWPGLGAKATNFDDGQYFLENRLVQNPSLDSVGHFFGEVLEPSTVMGYYQPLAMTSIMLDWALGGRPDNLRPFHITSLMLHVLNVALVIVLLYTLFGNAWVAASVGLLFGVHPQTVESIPWVGERKTLLAAFFVFWSLLLYVHYTRKRDWRFYGLAILAYVLALLSKPTSTPLPALLLLLDFWPLRRLNWRAVLEKIPFFAIGAGSAIITFISQERTAALAVLPAEHSSFQSTLTLCHNIVFYLRKMVWPTPLTSHYPFPEPFDLSQPAVLAGVIGTAVLIPVLVLSLRWTRALVTGWLFFFVAIFPTMGVITFTTTIASDKYAYLPVFGWLMVVALVLGKLWDAARRLRLSPVVRGGLLVIVLGLGTLEARATRAYLTYWQDTETLYRYMLTMAPRSERVHDYLGVQLCARGEIDEAISHYRTALEISPGDHSAHHNLGVALANQAKFEEAIEHFAEALRVDTKFGIGYCNMARALMGLGRNDEAQVNYERALQVDPYCADAHKGLAILLAMQRKFAESEVHFRDAIRVNPAYIEAYIGLERVLLAQRKIVEALGVLEEAHRRAPADPRVRADMEKLRSRLVPASTSAPAP